MTARRQRSARGTRKPRGEGGGALRLGASRRTPEPAEQQPLLPAAEAKKDEESGWGSGSDEVGAGKTDTPQEAGVVGSGWLSHSCRRA